MKILLETLDHLASEYEANCTRAKNLAENNQLLTLKVTQDDNPQDPREWDNIGTLICQHERFKLGDKHNLDLNDCTSWDEVKEKIIEEAGTDAIILPVYLWERDYFHGGVALKTEPYPILRRFNNGQVGYGQVGYIYALRNTDGHTFEKLTQILKDEIKRYSQFIFPEGDINALLKIPQNPSIVFV
jgi:hypothetical protein